MVAVQPTALKAISTPGESSASKLWLNCSTIVLVGVLESFQVCSVLLEQVFKSLEVSVALHNIIACFTLICLGFSLPGFP